MDSYTAFNYFAITGLPLIAVKKLKLRVKLSNHFYHAVFFLIFFTILLNYIYIHFKNGHPIFSIFNLKYLVINAIENTSKRYSIGGSYSSGNSGLLSLTYLGLFVLGCDSNTTRRKLMLLISVCFLLIYGFVTTEKYLVFLGLIYLLLGKLVFGEFDLLFFVIVIILLAVGIALTQLVRGASSDILDSFYHYFLIQYSAFGSFLSTFEYTGFSGIAFVGIADFFGLISREAGVWQGNYYNLGVASNIFTSYKYWISDFGFYSIPFFYLCVSVFLLRYERMKFSDMLYVYLLVSVLLTPNVTLFVHNVNVLTLGLIFIFLLKTDYERVN